MRPEEGIQYGRLDRDIVDGRRSPIRPSRIGSIVWLIFDSSVTSVAFSFTASIATIGALQYAIGLLHMIITHRTLRMRFIYPDRFI